MKISASIEIQPYEYALIRDYINGIETDYPGTKVEESNVYTVAFRRGMESVLDDFRKERRQKAMEDWVNGTTSHVKKEKAEGMHHASGQ